MGSTGCTSKTSSDVATPQTSAAPTAPAPTLQPAAAPATPAPAAPAPTAAAKPAGPSPVEGKAIVKRSCAVAGCHGSSIVDYHASQATASRVVASMAPNAGLSQAQQDAVIAYIAQ
jgi:cytochrome c5